VQTVSLSLYVAKPRYVSFLIYNVDLLLIVSDNGLQPCTCSRLIYQFLIEYQETDGWIENIVLRFLYLSTKITFITKMKSDFSNFHYENEIGKEMKMK
jgi:hypothetical protein